MSTENNLSRILDDIESRTDFVIFVQKLINDFRLHPDEWENQQLDRYLESVAAWTEDMDGYFLNRGEKSPTVTSWRLLGQILLAAKYYE